MFLRQKSWNPRMSEDTHINDRNEQVEFEREDLTPRSFFISS